MRLEIKGSFEKVYFTFEQSYELRCGASVGTDEKMFRIRRLKISACFKYLNPDTALMNTGFVL